MGVRTAVQKGKKSCFSTVKCNSARKLLIGANARRKLLHFFYLRERHAIFQKAKKSCFSDSKMQQCQETLDRGQHKTYVASLFLPERKTRYLPKRGERKTCVRGKPTEAARHIPKKKSSLSEKVREGDCGFFSCHRCSFSTPQNQKKAKYSGETPNNKKKNSTCH